MPEGSEKCGTKEESEENYFTDSESKSILNRYELKLIDCVKAKSRTQKTISRRLGLNVCIVCELIDGLLLKGQIERHRKRRLFFWYKELFSATLDGLAVLEQDRRANNGRNKNSLRRLLFSVHPPARSRL
ncbi:MAG: hypothetical protein M3297_06245 [Thermoproteota archaeon]|jgi:hypothetical protein|nr:hypothetical protein [Thermoproteota archaeon]